MIIVCGVIISLSVGFLGMCSVLLLAIDLEEKHDNK